MKILFVCSSNVCRSPYCEFVFKKMAENDPALKEAVERVDSAAVLNFSEKLHKLARASLMKEGFSAEELDAFVPKHRLKAKAVFAEADEIIGMTRWHKFLLPKAERAKFKTLSEAAEGKYSPIPDPFLAKSQEEYDKAMDIIKKYLEEYAAKIKERHNGRKEQI